MRIVVNDIAASSGGALTVLKDFYNCVKENDTENEWIFLLGDNLLSETDNIKIITLPEIKNSRVKKLLFDLFFGKKFINSLKPDVVFSLQNIITFGLQIPQVVYIHQSIPFQKVKKFSFFKARERSLAVYQYLIGAIIKNSAKKSTKIIVQTEWMKEAVCEQCKILPEKVYKVTPNVKDVFLLSELSYFDNKSFFYPTSPEVYKNNKIVFEACEILDKERFDYTVTLTLPKDQTAKNIKCVGRISYDEVIQSYGKSTLVFPSYIETFGYPLAEAKNVGTVILSSDCPFSREVLKNYENAYFFDPFAPEQLAELMNKVIAGEIVKKDIKKTKYEIIDSWETVVDIIKEKI